ncbi:MAG: hypothetical protein HYY11_03000 [Candidatus Methylomirabilis oxyfera]|nr:hypothetical protein [Candidatus Methylomirabilis oxyfera]
MSLPYEETREHRADVQIRRQLLAAAHGDDREAAIAAPHSLRRLYRLRLPLVEARLNGASRKNA